MSGLLLFSLFVDTYAARPSGVDSIADVAALVVAAVSLLVVPSVVLQSVVDDDQGFQLQLHEQPVAVSFAGSTCEAAAVVAAAPAVA